MIILYWMLNIASYNSAVIFMTKFLVFMKDIKNTDTFSQPYLNSFVWHKLKDGSDRIYKTTKKCFCVWKLMKCE